LVLLSLLVVLVIGVSSDAQNQDLPFFPCQESDDFALVTLDNATIEEGFLSTCLVVGYTWYGGSEAADGQYLRRHVMLALSMDNVSWLDCKGHGFDRYENESQYFRVYNSLTHPFPFDVEAGETLYVCILYGTGFEWELPVLSEPSFNNQTPSVGIAVPSGIYRHWYFSIDWRVSGIFGFVLFWIAAVFLISRPLKQGKLRE